MASLTPSQRAMAHARAAEELLDAVATTQPVVKPQVQLLAVSAQALVSIATSLAVLVNAAEREGSEPS